MNNKIRNKRIAHKIKMVKRYGPMGERLKPDTPFSSFVRDKTKEIGFKEYCKNFSPMLNTDGTIVINEI